MSEPTAAVGAASFERPPLDDVMLAMDVVDTLRRRDRLVARELDEAGREADLKQRLKGIYAQQGIDVPDHVIEQGVAALKEDRFTYQPVQSGFARRLAVIYVSRRRWGKWVAGGLAAALLVWAGNYVAFVAPDKTLPEDLDARYQEVVAIAASDEPRSRAQQLLNAGNAALRNEDTQAAREALAQLEQLQAVLQQEYSIQIVNRPDARSGVWRIPDVNEAARNYYIIVEAVSASGERLQVPIRNEETGKIELVSRWGLRVERPTFEAVARDKQDDGIIQNDRFGLKRAGYLDPEYAMPTSGGAITQW
ncbi:MAG: DUF6384 family protein [Sedimenticolaceae bacterium]